MADRQIADRLATLADLAGACEEIDRLEGRRVTLVVAATRAGATVSEVVRAVAAARGWPSTWLNEQATTYMPQIPDRHSQVVFDHPALQVAAASATHMLAMKARAARAQDIADVTSLLRRCGLTTPDEVDKLTQGVFGEPLGPRQQRWIEDLIDHITHSPTPDSDTPPNDPAP